jgi:hypothetical protein
VSEEGRKLIGKVLQPPCNHDARVKYMLMRVIPLLNEVIDDE